MKEGNTYTEEQVGIIMTNLANAFNVAMKDNKLNNNRRNKINRKVNAILEEKRIKQ